MKDNEPTGDPDVDSRQLSVETGATEPAEDSSHGTDEGAGTDKPLTAEQRAELAEKRVKDNQAAFTKQAQKIAELERELKLAQLGKKVERLEGRQEEKPSDPFENLESEIESELDGEIFNDEAVAKKKFAKAVTKAVRKAMGVVGETLVQRDAFFEERLKSADPTRRELAERIETLRADPEYQDASEDELLRAAKRDARIERERAKGKEQEDDGWRGAPGVAGGGRRMVRGGDDSFEREVQRNLRFIRGSDA